MLPALAQAVEAVGVVFTTIIFPAQGSTGPAGGSGDGSLLLQATKLTHTKNSVVRAMKFTVALFINDFLKESYPQLNGLPVSKKRLHYFT